MGALQLLPGEKEELHLHPAPSSQLGRKAWALGYAAWGACLWATFHSAWWTGHTPSDWTAPWTWLWGNDGAAYLWTVTGLAAGGAAASLPRGPWTRLGVAAGAGVAIALAVALAAGAIADEALPVLTALASVPALAWTEARRWGTSYHVTNLRIVLRTTVPARTERSALYTDLVDLDTRGSPWPDTGTLIPITAKPAGGHPPRGGAGEADAPRAAEPMRLVGVRPFRRVHALVQALARRATASDYAKAEEGLDDRVAQAVAGLCRP